MPEFKLIAFDADDTLWHNEVLYLNNISRLQEILSPYARPDQVAEMLDAVERSNLSTLGYGIKSFTLSMLETALKISAGRVRSAELEAILEIPRQMLATTVELFEHTRSVIDTLAQDYRLMIITKGDLFEQELKIERTGLHEQIPHIEVVAEKNPASYTRILSLLGIPPEQFLMVGNSLRSDIEPVLSLGGYAVYIPYSLTWAHENETQAAINSNRCFELEHLGLLPDLLAGLRDHRPA